MKIYRTLKSFHTDNLAIRASLGMRIDACKSSTRKLSHVSKFEQKFALVADFLVFEDRHFTGNFEPQINPFDFCPINPVVLTRYVQ